MLRVVIFDLGGTLIDNANQPFPHVREALTAISGFVAENGTSLRSCLVSNFTMATPPVTATKVAALFNEYLAILDETGLRSFFEPVKKRVTLSTHAGVSKPTRKIFEKALQRLGASTIPLEDCLLITEDPSHIQKTRTELHMQALQFGVDFDDWEEAPALIAQLVAPHQFANTVVEKNMPRKQKKDTRKAAGIGQPSGEQAAEEASFLKSLETHGQIARPGEPNRNATHEMDKKGKPVRKRFSAI